MATCSAPTCGQTAVLAWQRAASPDEAAAANQHAQTTRRAIVDQQRSNALLHLVELRGRLEQLTAAAAAGDQDAATVLPTMAQNISAAQAALDAITDPDLIPLDQVSVAVAGCDQHAVSADASTWLHQPGCLTDGSCHCTPPEASVSDG